MKNLATISFSLILLAIMSLAILNSFSNSPIHYIVVKSGSMSPSINTGDLAFVYKVSTNQINIGDIVLYARAGNLVIHRIMNNNPNCLITKGDANIDPDIGCSKPVIGKYLFKIPWLGYPLFYFQQGIIDIINLLK
jgi:signal peptidase I